MKKLYLSTALILMAGPVLADITPQQLYESWQRTIGRLGGTLTANIETQGSTLILHNLKSEFDFGFVDVNQTLEEIRLEGHADGSVYVIVDTALSSSGVVKMSGIPDNSIVQTGQIIGLRGHVTGDPDDYFHAFSAERIEISGQTEMSGLTNMTNTTIMQIVMQNMEGTIRVVETDLGEEMSYDFTIGEYETVQDVEQRSTADHPTPGVKQHLVLTAQDYSGTALISLPNPQSPPSTGSLLPDGFSLNAELNMGSVSLDQMVQSQVFGIRFGFEQTNSGMGLQIDARQLSATTNAGNTQMRVEVLSKPGTVYGVDIAQSSASFSLPLHPGNAVETAKFDLAFSGLTLNDTTWNTFDTNHVFDRGPASLNLSAEAEVTLHFDWTNPQAYDAPVMPPLTLHRARLNALSLSAEAAEVTGDGEVDFATTGGAVAPNGGELGFSLTGVLGLLNKIGQVEGIDPMFAVGASGAIGMFTAPTDVADSFTTAIEFGSGGKIIVNGVPVN